MRLRPLCGSAIPIGLITMLISAPSAVAGQVTCTAGCDTPNRPVCTDKCVFLDATDYALNGVQLMLQKPELFTRVVNEARRRTGLALPGAGEHWPDGDYRWWSDWIILTDVQQTTDLGSPEKKRTVVRSTIRAPTLFANCGIGEKVYKRAVSDLFKEQEKREHEETEKLTQQKETELTVGASYAKVVSASTRQKMTSSIEQTRRDYLMHNQELQITHALSDDIKVPKHSIADASVTETNSIDIYEVQGVVTTDAMLNAEAAGHRATIGRWSDYWGADERHFPVTITFSVPLHSVEVSSKVDQFPNEGSCLAAEAKWRASAN